MELPGSNAVRRTIMAAYLCLAVGIPSLIGVAVVRQQAEHQRARAETARLLLAQALGAQVERGARTARAVLAMIATDPDVGSAFASASYGVLEQRLREGLHAGRFEALELRDDAGHPLFGVAAKEPASAATARLRFHRTVRSGEHRLGEMVAVVPVATLVDASAYSPGLGHVALTGIDGRILMDEEGSRSDVVIDVPEADLATLAPVESGTTSAGSASAVAFAVAGDLPVLVAVSAAEQEARWPWSDLVIVDALLLAVGWLVASNVIGEPPSAGRLAGATSAQPAARGPEHR